MQPQSSITHTINGKQLDSQYAKVQQGSTFLAGITTSRQELTASMRQGTIPSPYRPQFESRTVDIILNSYGDEFSSETARIVRLATLPQVTLGRTVNGVQQQALAELVSVSEGDSDLPHVEPVTLRFSIPGVWWRGVTPMTMRLPLTGGTIFPHTGPAITNNVGYWTTSLGEPDNSPSALADFITMPLGTPDNSPSLLWTELPDDYLSDAPIPDAIIQLPPNVTEATITDPLSQTGITWSGSESNQYTYLDAGNLTAWRSSSATAWSGGTAVTGVDYPAMGPLQINPQMDGSYSLDCDVTGVSSGNILIYFYQSWW